MSLKKKLDHAHSIIHVLGQKKNNKIRGSHLPNKQKNRMTLSKLKERLEKERREIEKLKPNTKKLLIVRRGNESRTKYSSPTSNGRIKKEITDGKKLIILRKTVTAIKVDKYDNIREPLKSITISKRNDVVKKALLIGINYTGTQNELNGCKTDMVDMVDFLVGHNYFNKSEITTMSDDEKGTQYPTKANILAQLESMVAFAKSNPKKDVLLFMSYSGHGTQMKDDHDDVKDQDDLLCPIDCLDNYDNLIRDDLLKSIIDRLPANVKFVIFLDCCHSATMMDTRYEYEVDDKHKFVVYDKEAETNADVVVLSGTRDEGVSYDAFVQGKNQGAFSAAFFQAYKDGISYFDLVTKVREWLKNNNYAQIPQLSSGKHIGVSNPFLLNSYSS